MANLNAKIGDMTYDGLVTDVNPAVIVAGGVIAHGVAAASFVRGTLLEKGSDGKLVIFGTNPAGTLTEEFDGDGTTKTFTLTATVKPVQVTAVVGDTETACTYDAQAGKVTFATAPAAGTDNVVISYENPAANEPDCILCDDVDVAADADKKVAVYIAGCFDPDKLTLAEGATLGTAAKDVLREKGIIFKAAAAAN